MKQFITTVSFCCLIALATLSNGCSSSTDPADSVNIFSMTLIGAPEGSRNFAAYTMATLLTADSTLSVVGSNTPLNSSITKNNFAIVECRGTALGRHEVNLDTTYSPANMMVMVGGKSYFAISGSVTITAFGAVGSSVSGTFEGVFVGDNDARMQVTNGTFTIKRAADNSRVD